MLTRLTASQLPHIFSIDPSLYPPRLQLLVADILRTSFYHSIAPDDPPFNAITVPREEPVMATNVNKNFDSVDKLKDDASNYRIWIARIHKAIKASRGRALIATAPNGEAATILNDEIVNAICGKLPNTIYKSCIWSSLTRFLPYSSVITMWLCTLWRRLPIHPLDVS